MAEKVFIDKSVLITGKNPAASRKHNALDLKSYINDTLKMSYGVYSIDTNHTSTSPLQLNAQFCHIIPGGVLSSGEMYAQLPNPAIHGYDYIVGWNYDTGTTMDIVLLPYPGTTINLDDSWILSSGSLIKFKFIPEYKVFTVVSQEGKITLYDGTSDSPNIYFNGHSSGIYGHSQYDIIMTGNAFADESKVTVNSANYPVDTSTLYSTFDVDTSSNAVTFILNPTVTGFTPSFILSSGSNSFEISMASGVNILGVTTKITVSGIGSTVTLKSLDTSGTYAIIGSHGTVTIT